MSLNRQTELNVEGQFLLTVLDTYSCEQDVQALFELYLHPET